MGPNDIPPSSFHSFEQAMQSLSQRLSSRGLMRESVVARLLQHVALRLGEDMDAPFKAHGLNTTLWTSMLVIYAAQGHRLKPSELSVFMNSSRTNSTRVARELGRHGFVRRVADESDGRQRFLQLTEKGVDFVQQQLPGRRRHVREVFDGFEPQEFTELERLLRKLLGTLDKRAAAR